jgi:hypothetical protein
VSDHPRRPGALTPDQSEERFDTDGLDFDRALTLVLKGGVDPDDEGKPPSDEREAEQ